MTDCGTWSRLHGHARRLAPAPSATPGSRVIGESEIYDALRLVLDPEVGINVLDLGLIYGVAVEGEDVRIDLTMTTPACPLGETLVRETRTALHAAGVAGLVDVNIVWNPPWAPEMMSSAAREQLGWNATPSSS